ncbi:MAG: cbb3-type cytochrome c oxidase N-terminal domain-containing protein [Saprospiraceae bacterium]
MNKLMAFLLSLTPMAAFISMAYSQGEVETFSDWAGENVVPLTLMLAVSAVLFGALATVFSLINTQNLQQAEARGVKVESTWTRLYHQYIYQPTPMSQERDILLDHDYDGIRELDNSMPPWWLYSFYLAIAFAVVYMGVFVTSDPDSNLHQIAEYKAEMASAKIAVEEYLANQADLVDETNAELLTDAAALGRGEATYTMYCVACHAADGGGGVGPNLTDNYWIHGDGTIKPVFTTVKNGVPEKGMIAWKTQLSASKIHEVASYIITLQGKTAAEPKEPQGDLVSGGEMTIPDTQPDAVEVEM